ncbi:hypothetical protein [Rhodopseudomonas sp. B29]|uniref:hypothetical protein n=1 Tax=Rhodopseudomonas sp. B29 TaxID=95607 RepID=UPI000347EDF0|nr:hypothetical protein [Rhodopseudomonas sp. B29]
MTPRLFSSLIAFSVLSTGAALAQDQGTAAQREACTPDAFRLCAQFIPDASRIEGCLRAAGPRLSPACHVVFFPDENKQQPMRTARRQSGMQPAASERAAQQPQNIGGPEDARAEWADE